MQTTMDHLAQDRQGLGKGRLDAWQIAALLGLFRVSAGVFFTGGRVEAQKAETGSVGCAIVIAR